MKIKFFPIMMITLLLFISGCGDDKKIPEYKMISEEGYYVEMIYKEDSKAYEQQKLHLDSIQKELNKKYKTDLTTINSKTKFVDGLQNKVLNFRDTSNLFVVYDKKNHKKMIGTIYGVFDKSSDFIKQLEKNVSDQSYIYAPDKKKFLYIHNSERIEYIDKEKFSRISEFYHMVYNKNDKTNKVFNNYVINRNIDDFIILDENNNLLLQYTMRDMLYYEHKLSKKIDLDSTIISRVLEIDPFSKQKKKTIIYFYNDKEPTQYTKQIVEVDAFKKQMKDTLDVNFQVFTVPLYNNNPRTNAMTLYMKRVFNVKDNVPTVIIMDDFNNMDKMSKSEAFQANKDLQHLYKNSLLK